jgi:hypothetical protein
MGYDLQLFKMILVYWTYKINMNSQIATKILDIYSEEHTKKPTQPKTYSML